MVLTYYVLASNDESNVILFYITLLHRSLDPRSCQSFCSNSISNVQKLEQFLGFITVSSPSCQKITPAHSKNIPYPSETPFNSSPKYLSIFSSLTKVTTQTLGKQVSSYNRIAHNLPHMSYTAWQAVDAFFPEDTPSKSTKISTSDIQSLQPIYSSTSLPSPLSQ